MKFTKEDFQMLIALLFWFVSYCPFILLTDFYYGTVLSVVAAIGVYSFIGKWIETLKKTDTCANK